MLGFFGDVGGAVDGFGGGDGCLGADLGCFGVDSCACCDVSDVAVSVGEV